MADISVRKRGEKWYYSFEAASVDGKRKRIERVGGRTKKEALEVGIKALNEYNNAGLHFDPSDSSVTDYMNYWYENYCMINLKYNTLTNYRMIIDNHINPNLGFYKLSSLTPAICQEFVNKKYLEGLSKSSLVNIFAVLSGALKYAVHPAKMIQSSPMLYIKYPKYDAKKAQVRFIIKPEEFKKITTRFDEKSNFYVPLMIGYFTGMRIGEVFGLSWEDIDLKEGIIHVRRQIIKRNRAIESRKLSKENKKKIEKSSWYIAPLKTASSERDIKISSTLLEVLKAARKKQLENEIEYGEFYTVHYLKQEVDEKNKTIYRLLPTDKSIVTSMDRFNPVCIHENGEYVSTDSFKYCSRVIHHELGIEFNFHSLRHTHATMLIEAGISPKAVQERLGHADIETTLNTYTQVTDSMSCDTATVFETLVNRA